MIGLIPFNFDQQIFFDPSADFDAFLKAAPARWVVYLMADEQDRQVQLLCVKNLRYSLKRRLGTGDEAVGLSKRVNYREIVRRVSWKRVDSTFEADAVYLEAARKFFPQTYEGMTGFRPAWFLHVNPEADFPRYTKTTDLGIRAGQLLGPVESKDAAQALIEDVQDWFDLCRYHHILVESPQGKPCAYKEMGKCPAPCDGTISMPQYRRLIEHSGRAIINSDELIREQTQRMQAAAKELRFETAAKIKSYIDSISQIGNGPLRHLRRLRDFNFLSLQHGPRAGTAKAFLITPGQIEEIAGLPIEPTRPSDLMRLALTVAAERACDSVDQAGAERIGVVTHHLFAPKAQQGVFLPLESIDEKQIVKAHRDLQKQKKPPEEASDAEGEGVFKELQAL
jgi:excinuclease UvrABC nuclease subunit